MDKKSRLSFLDDIRNNKRIAFISDVEIFNRTMGKFEEIQPEPTLNTKDKQEFIYNFINEELDEYKEACDEGDLVGIADALCDIMYVLCGGILTHGLKDKFELMFAEVQASNMSKVCDTEEDAIVTKNVRSKEQGRECYYEKVGDKWVVYRDDRKVMKNIKYFKPDLNKFLK